MQIVCWHTHIHAQISYGKGLFHKEQFFYTGDEICIDMYAMPAISDDGELYIGVLQAQRPHGFSWEW